MFDIKNINKKTVDIENGTILIAHPFLEEFFFKRSCVLLTKVEKNKPTVGFVLNNKTDFFLNELISGINPDKNLPVFCGGPLSLDRLFYIHDIDKLPNSIPLANGLFLNGDLDAIVDYINSSNEYEKHIKFFIGYSGWDPGQLEEEFTMDTWVSLPYIDKKFILNNDTDNHWETAVKLLGKEYNSWLIIPTEPLLN